MDILVYITNFILHLDKSLVGIMQCYGVWTYLLLFLIVFCETGLVITPFLPGDSLIFASGALAAMNSLNSVTFFTVFFMAAIIGDTVNYHIGKNIGKIILAKENIRFIRKDHVDKANEFYKKHGSMTIAIGRFIPIIRTFVPFLAGIGEMNYLKFVGYNILGGLLWVTLFLSGGYFFGNLPLIKDNFSFVLIAIIAISIIPGIIALIRERKNMKNHHELNKT
ncbi:DedA family protein [Acetobacterium woodii]|uniref:Membrane protein, DedA family n=1 Tax=Acetobacterium woodii (strain ATCC 29683 / DSM 1030 / JCM 2381 / KCTC 1655 / WB1) TaxID=931626 RepID=H6LFJ9_ACEWD|nr:DedA family protein [Acetobacterium woodii]AFA49486.1 membrane protein, DedA family [Acetobacterium woodii DSM 1030]